VTKAERLKKWRRANPEQVRAHSRTNNAKPGVRQKKQEWLVANSEYHAKYARENRAQLQSQKCKRQRLLREAAIQMYGGQCECCGERTFEFLAFDHRHGGGKNHRAQFGGMYGFLRWLLKEIQKDIRILCHNCNSALGYHGYCPHQGVKE
jgi:hypothetical protein